MGRIDARNSLETYCYNIKSTIDDKLGDKLDDDDKEKVIVLARPHTAATVYASQSCLSLLCHHITSCHA